MLFDAEYHICVNIVNIRAKLSCLDVVAFGEIINLQIGIRDLVGATKMKIVVPLHPRSSRSSHSFLKSLHCGEFKPGGRANIWMAIQNFTEG